MHDDAGEEDGREPSLTRGTRARLARAPTSAVLPTPGDPSTSTALRSCSARSSRNALRAVVGADSSNCAAGTGALAAGEDDKVEGPAVACMPPPGGCCCC